jgi:hypothetical protein
MRPRSLFAGAVALLLAAGLVVTPHGPASAAVSTSLVPYRMDASNQAGWWKPIEEFNGSVYMAYNAWNGATGGGTDDGHTVWIAKRSPDGGWSRGCLPGSAGGCAVFTDDIGHNQPTIAIDGDGYIHVFASMHNVGWRYYRSSAPGAVASMVNRSAQLPDRDGRYTYPATTRASNGDVYLVVRSYPAGRLYRWSDAADTWSRVATFASQAGYVVYPDDISADGAGNLHIAWEWAYASAGGLRHLGSYLRYRPASNQFENAAGTRVAVPATTASPVGYQPIGELEKITDRGTADPGVQSAKVAVDPAGNPVVAYRYRSTVGGFFRVWFAMWTGAGWQRQLVYQGAYDTHAAVDVSVLGSAVRVYYVKRDTLGDQAFVAGSADGGWAETSLLPGVRVERLSVIRRGPIDHLYLAVPGATSLYYGRNPW